MRWWFLILVVPLALAGCQETPEPGPWAGQEYVALGDSYTAAPRTGTNLGRYCYQSSRNYPRLVAAALDLELTDASCGGARIRNLTTVQRRSGAPPQFDSLSTDTDLVTLRLGANNSRLFGRTAYSCWQLAVDEPDGAPCTRAMGGQAYLDAVTEQIALELEVALAGIEERAPDARVLVIGYPEWAPPVDEGACPQLPVADGDVAFVRRANEIMVEELEEAAAEASVEYVDVWSATEGHHMCATDPWVAGVQPDWTAAPLHPYPEEQRVTADLVVEQLAQDRSNRGAR